MSDDGLMNAATNSRRVALVRIEKGHRGTPPGFLDILSNAPDDHVDAVVAKVHGDVKYGNQGEARQTYEVLAYANELVRYGRPLHDFHTRLYAWALLFPVHQIGTLEVAANNFGRLRRAWPGAVVLSRRTAKELSVPFAEEDRQEEYLEELIEVPHEAEHAVEEQLDARTVALTSAFPAPSYVPVHRRAQDAARITSRGLLPTAWCYGVIRAPRHFDLSRWFPRYPRWWLNHGVCMEMPHALSYMAHELVDEFSAVWHVVNAEECYFLAAGWVHILMTDQVFAWLDAKVIRRVIKLDLHHMASGPGGQAMLDMFHNMNRATEVLPWTFVVKDVIRRDTQTRTARQVHIHMDPKAEYGFTLNYPCQGFASRSAWGAGTGDEKESPAAAAQGNGGFFRRGTRPAGGPSRRAASPSRRGSLSPVREKRVASSSGGNERSQLEDMWTSVEALQAATALFGEAPSRRRDGQRVPRGVGTAALALALYRQTEAVRRAVREPMAMSSRTPCRFLLVP